MTKQEKSSLIESIKGELASTNETKECQTHNQALWTAIRIIEQTANTPSLNAGSLETPSGANHLVEALQNIIETCGTVNFSSHNQMKEAINGAMELAENSLAQYNAVEPEKKPFNLEGCELKPLNIKPPSFGRYVCLVKAHPMPYATYLKVLEYGIGFDGVEGFLQEGDDFRVTAWFSKFPFLPQSPPTPIDREPEGIDPQELWDDFSEYVDSDISDLDRFAGSDVMTKSSFFKLASKYQITRK